MEGDGSSFDHFVEGKAALALAFAWGLAEATVFFLVPDIVVTMVACRALKPALKATVAAVAGALIGGAMMYAFATSSPAAARDLLDHIPSISPELIAIVESRVASQGLIAVLLGPLSGIPYKIYAVEWGALGKGLTWFLLISVPARWIRFALTALATRALARAIEPWTKHQARTELLILLAVWTAFYSFYFSRFGW